MAKAKSSLPIADPTITIEQKLEAIKAINDEKARVEEILSECERLAPVMTDVTSATQSPKTYGVSFGIGLFYTNRIPIPFFAYEEMLAKVRHIYEKKRQALIEKAAELMK